ncbi:P49 [Indian peanut clump virus]|uniref:p49 n=1 Tax=Indian peanut clump virus TaxID=32629 RepID=Q8B0Z6_9VIRU|nr:P49 protein [Indian peanut clump virus]AAO15499.1 P49 [Indian peanut clump virus H]
MCLLSVLSIAMSWQRRGTLEKAVNSAVSGGNGSKPVEIKRKGRSARGATKNEAKTWKEKYPPEDDYSPEFVDNFRQSVANEKFQRSERRDGYDQVRLGSDNFVGDDPLKVIAEEAVAAGFQATGKVMKRFPADVFERSKFIGMYDRHLSALRDKACCKGERDQVQSKLIQTRTLAPTCAFLAGTVTGVPGSGKSTLLKKVQKRLKNSVCLLANKELKGDFAGVPSVFSVEEMLLTAVPSKFSVMLVDEYTLVQSAEILLLQRKLEAKIVVLFGDREQGNTNKLTSPEWLHVPIVFSSDLSYRFGSETAKFCGDQGFSLQGKGSEDKVVTGDYEGEGEDTEVNLCFTEETKKDLAEVQVEAFLVSSVQGKTFPSVSLFVREGDKQAFSDPHLRLVAITRHRKLLSIRAEPEVWISFMFPTREGEKVDTHCYGEEHCPDETE